MSKTYRPYSPKQSFLLPASPLDWLPTDHLAYFVLDVVPQLDLSAILGHYEREVRGYPPHDPRMMVALLLYGYCVGVTSSRKLERKTYEDVAFRVIAGGNHPDHTRISEFRRIHAAAFEGLYVEVLQLCIEAGLVKLGHVALDGTKLKANASKHKAMSYGRMKEREAELRRIVREIMQQAEDTDAAEDALYGKDKRGDEVPEELRDPKKRLQKIRELKAKLEAEAKRAREAEERGDKGEDDELPSHRVPSDKSGKPTDKAQRNFTDPESRIQKTNDGYVQGYNCQIAVDDEHQVIVAQAVTNQPPDCEHLRPMLRQVVANCGVSPINLSADAGYYSDANVMTALELGSDPHIATDRKKHRETSPQVRGRPPKGMTMRQWMARRLGTKKGSAVYRRRKAIVEPVFGQIKQARGIRQFSMRGVAKVRGEWSLICLTHNLLKLRMALQG